MPDSRTPVAHRWGYMFLISQKYPSFREDVRKELPPLQFPSSLPLARLLFSKVLPICTMSLDQAGVLPKVCSSLPDIWPGGTKWDHGFVIHRMGQDKVRLHPPVSYVKKRAQLQIVFLGVRTIA